MLNALPGISRAIGDGADPANPGHSCQENRVKTGPASDGGGNAGCLGRTQAYWLERHPGPSHAALVLRRRPTCLPTDPSPPKPSPIPTPTKHTYPRQGPQGAVPAVV